MENVNSNNNMVEDDGSLSFLNLPKREDNKQFHCDTINQSELINQKFWILDYQPDVKTKFGEGKYIVYIKFDLNDSDDRAKKFFTGSVEIKDVLDKIRERDAFPRKMTLKKHKQSYWLE